jgi:hypothetical protein
MSISEMTILRVPQTQNEMSPFLPVKFARVLKEWLMSEKFTCRITLPILRTCNKGFGWDETKPRQIGREREAREEEESEKLVA